jgi:hypothetical protein
MFEGEDNTGRKLAFPLPQVASFAIWDEKKPRDRDPKIIEESIDKLNVNYVFVALNFAGTGGPIPTWWKNWNNFHCSTRDNDGDDRLQNLLNRSPFQGAYMTDIIKNYPTRNAATLAAQIQNIDERTHIQWFIDEINLLETDNIQMYLFGKDVEDKVIKYSDLLKPIREKISLCQRITHFGPAATKFPTWVPVQLGLKDNNVGATIYKPLWDAEEEARIQAIPDFDEDLY